MEGHLRYIPLPPGPNQFVSHLRVSRHVYQGTEYGPGHRSSPPKASSSTTLHEFTYPQTQQHPHPVPRIQEQRTFAQSLYADSTTVFGPDDILPITESGNTISNEEPEPLDMFRHEEELHKVTPGGSKDARLNRTSVDCRESHRDGMLFVLW